MASSSPQSQPTISFPRTRSARRLAAPSAKGDPYALALRPSPRSKTSDPADPGQATPGARSGRTTAQPLSPKVQPLSPRKRLGDDNLCNVPHALPGSPAKRSKENRGRRLLFGDPSASPEQPKSPGPSPRSRGPETPRSSGQHPRTQLFRQEGTCYQQVKQVLHAAVPDRLQGRERETGILRQFLREHVLGRRPGSLYVSGAPGTGKTACLSRVLLDCKDELARSKTVVLNCMALGSPQSVFPALAQHLGLPVATGRERIRSLEKHLTAQGPMVLLVLDELDQLESKGQDVLYTLFEWPQLPNSRLVLVGLANALDLTDRSLARLGAHPTGSPQLLHFPPYTKEQLTCILQERLGQVAGDPVLDSAALQFCARKVSAVSGDARKALDVCRSVCAPKPGGARASLVPVSLPCTRVLVPGVPALPGAQGCSSPGVPWRWWSWRCEARPCSSHCLGVTPQCPPSPSAWGSCTSPGCSRRCLGTGWQGGPREPRTPSHCSRRCCSAPCSFSPGAHTPGR
uniref:Cell division cycle 6 n=1 Tax=Catharus ustulatus TaxID=91951 RepID=A0A8C3US23_CATUS